MINDQFRPFNGCVSYIRGDEESVMKDLEFNQAYFVYYEETLNITGKYPMNIRFTISAEELVMGTASQSNNWPVA